MKLSLNWIKDYIELSDDIDKISNQLTMLGLEVEGGEHFESIKGGLEGLVVGKVISAEQHPNADKLSVCKVDVGGDELLNIVCGAPNVAANQKVVVATVGTTLFPTSGDSFKIKKSKIRGEVSEGMICAEDEIGLGENHDGIMVLSENTEVGTKADQVFDIEKDYVFEIGLTPNRIDGAHHFGAARDLATVNKSSAKLPEIDESLINKFPCPIEIEVKNTEKCPIYSGIVIKNVKVEPSPKWLQNRLLALGERPINNIVDITNYVLLECGNPLHAFDLSKISGNKIIIDTARSGDKFVTLDEKNRELSEHDLMIKNATEENMCIAGVMGGIDSGVKDETTDVFIESAYFSPNSIRKTAKSQGIHSNASFRFERGVDPNIYKWAVKRAANLICEIAGGEASEIVEVINQEFPPFEVEFSYSKARKIIGNEISDEKMNEIIESLEMSIEKTSDSDKVIVKVPQYRVDVLRFQDLVEDILRVYGYNNVEIPSKMAFTPSYISNFDLPAFKTKVSDYFAANGLYEAITNSLINPKNGSEDAIRLLNQSNPEMSIMRESMLPGTLDIISYNYNHKNKQLAFFEFGKTYQQKNEQYIEDQWLTIALSGEKNSKKWNQDAQDFDFFDLKKFVEKLGQWLGLDFSLKPISENGELAFGLDIFHKKAWLGNLGEVKSNICKEFNISKEVFFAKFNWEKLVDLYKNQKIEFSPISKFQAKRRDVSFIINKSVTFGDIFSEIKQSNPKIISDVDIFDIYEGEPVPEKHINYAISIIFENPDKELNDKVLDKSMSKIFKILETKFNAEIRK